MKRSSLLGMTVLGLALGLLTTASAQQRPSAFNRSYSHSNYRGDHHRVSRPRQAAVHRQVFRRPHGPSGPFIVHPARVRFFGRPPAIFYPPVSHYTGPIYYRRPLFLIAPIPVFPEFHLFYRLP